MPYQTAKKTGFTLIELLVAIGIMVAVMGSGTVILSGFSKRQQTQAVARELQTFLRSGQNYARVGTLPSDCTRPLVSYDIVFVTNAGATLTARCTDNTGSTISSTITTSFNKGTTYPISLGPLTTSFTIRFLPLYGGVQISTNGINFSDIAADAPKPIYISRFGTTPYVLYINSSGAISDPVPVEGG